MPVREKFSALHCGSSFWFYAFIKGERLDILLWIQSKTRIVLNRAGW